MRCSAPGPAHAQKGRGLQLEAPDLAADSGGGPHARELARLGRLLRLEEAVMEADICKCALFLHAPKLSHLLTLAS
jgi:hypothetical protein